MRKLIEKLDNSILWQVVFFGVTMSCLLVIYFSILDRIELNKILYKKTKTDYNVISEIETIEQQKDQIIISGTAFRLASNTTDIKIVLNTNTGSGNILMNTVSEMDTAKKEAYDKEWDYGVNSFESSISIKKLEANVCYEIMVDLTYSQGETAESNNIRVSTLYYLYNNQIYHYNPMDYEKPEFEDTYMKEVVEFGKLVLLSKEKGLRIYQYNGYLHWVTDETFEFIKSPGTRIIYLPKSYEHSEEVGTVEANGLPAGDFWFSEHEYELSENSKYRVSIAEIPQSIPVTYIKIGVYDTENLIWCWDLDLKIE